MRLSQHPNISPCYLMLIRPSLSSVRTYTIRTRSLWLSYGAIKHATV